MALRQTQNADWIVKNSIEQQPDLVPDDRRNDNHEQPAMDNAEWEERLFQINGNQMKLKYKALHGDNAGTREFEFEDNTLKIDKWIQVEPSRLHGEVFSYEKETQKDINYVSQGGMASFVIQGMDTQKAQMLTLNIVIHEQGEAEVFFMLNEPVELKLGNNFTLELEYGKYAKMASDPKGTMYFQDTKIYYKDKLIQECTQVESDGKGLRFDGESTLFFEDLIPTEEEKTLEGEEKQNKEVAKLSDAKIFFDENGPQLEIWENMFLHFHGDEIKISYKPLKKEERFTSQYRLSKEEWELQKGFKLYPKETGGTITEKKENWGKDKTVNFFSWKGGKLFYKAPNLKHDKGREVPLEYLSVQMNPDKQVQIGFGINQSNIMVIPVFKDEYTLNIILQNGVYDEKDGELKFWDSKVFYKGKMFGNIEALISDEHGLHMPGNEDAFFGKAIVTKKNLDTELIEQEDYDDLDNQDLEIKVGLEFSEDEINFFVMKNKIYRTLDKFAEIRDVEEEVDEEGNVVEGGEIEGKLYLSDIPIFLFMNNKNEPKKELAKAPEEAVEGVLVTEDKNNEEKFSAKKEEPISITYDLVELEVETGSGTTTYAKKVTLDGIEVKDGILTVEKVTIENALGREQESEEEAKEIFNCTVSGSILHGSDSVEFSPEGLVAIEGKTTLGTLSIEDFLGFLSGEVNYPEGKIKVSAGKDAETETPTILEFAEENLGEGLNIPIPGTMGILNAKFVLAPKAKIGGSVELEANRGKSLGDKWEHNDPLALTGTVALNGEAGLEAGAGLAAGIPYLANIDLMLTASLLAELAASISVNAQLMCIVENKQGKEKKHLEQAEDLSVSGEFGAKLVGTVSLGSSVKFLFWKKNILDLELYSKTLGEVQVSMEAKKKKGSKGITSGWEMTDKKGFAKGLSKSVEIGFLDKEAKEQALEEKRKAILEDAQGKAEEAWAALLQLESGNQKETLIVLEEAEQKKLGPQMEAMKKDVEKKINTYKKLLEGQKKRTEDKKQRAIDERETQKKILDKAVKDMNLPDEFRDMALLGGMKEEDYANTDVETTSIDFIIYKALGEVSEENLYKKTARYHRTAKEKNNWSNMDDETKSEYYHEATLFGTKYNDEAAEKYRKDMSYYKILSSKVSSLNVQGKNKGNRGLVPFKYETIVTENPDMSIKELLQLAVKDQDKEGNKIGATAKEKEQLLEACFNFKFSTKDVLNIKGKGKLNASQAWLKEMDDVVSERLGRADVTLRGLIEAAKKKNIHESIASARIKMTQADERIIEAGSKITELENQIWETDNKITECNNKLDMLTQNAVGALKHKEFDENLASQAIKIYTEDYLGKMKPESEKLEKAGNEGN